MQKIKELELNGFDFDAITVNCSTMELEDKNLHEELYDIISANEINPSHVRIEITESTTVSNYDNILYNMKKLCENGISFYLDDFGTGYSNLERIVAYPFQTIKFDKSILYKALEDSKANEMIHMLVHFFSHNGLKTVVEGVEDQMQYDFCKEVGFNYIQGYLFSKPIPADDITKFFSK